MSKDCENIKLPEDQGCKDAAMEATHHFAEGMYFLNGNYYGDVIGVDGNEVAVICKNGNPYMEGQITTLTFTQVKSL